MTTSTNVPRSDHELQQAVLNELDWTPEVDASHIGVTAISGAVTLTGEVSSYSARLAAKKAALRVRGVTALADELTVHYLGGPVTDTDIAEAALGVLRRNAVVPEGAVTAEVRNHAITLTGDVDWNYEREAAARAVEHLRGVRSVENLITLKGRASAVDTKTRVKNAIARQAALDAESILVTVDGTEVTLTGRVASWNEKKAAGKAAWASPHVSAVLNLLEVRPS
ncbi:BON domain-containing protein [Arthrobacter bambusae]|uniref:BON domain-containing protein n=1 Tax=Arthrobacter bambusae TaxID=1338426 RepID=UPI002785FCA0|nr:BON domain-containing protein [Arthrobacter bambusae]MDQ0028693.1 osmotically-inducible protein OsmY [Arthrobacter bambusae]MDQ0096513.1 osmotically-inducible protein OsmY [Arthrobacter bambusae]